MEFTHVLSLAVGLAIGSGAAHFLARRKKADERGPDSGGVGDSQHPLALGLAESSPVPSILINSKGHIQYSNPAAVKTFGQLSEGMLLSLRFRVPELRAAIEAAVVQGRDTSFELAERQPVERWFLVDVCHAGSSASNSYLALYFRDQSDARKLDRMRSDFVANASHELRTPLASMTGFIETLKGPARNDVAAREKFLDIMQHQAGRMARLIDDLLSLSRLEMRPVLAYGQTVDMQLTVDHVLDALRPLSTELGVTVERNFSDGPFLVGGARDELIQVIENLVENSCKYGQLGKKVVVSLSASVGEVRLSVRDFGPGIAAEHIPRLTERFYRVDAGASRAQKGTGLGLAIVKHILNRHQARLTVISAIGEGAEFVVSFPVPGSVEKQQVSA